MDSRHNLFPFTENNNDIHPRPRLASHTRRFHPYARSIACPAQEWRMINSNHGRDDILPELSVLSNVMPAGQTEVFGDCNGDGTQEMVAENKAVFVPGDSNSLGAEVERGGDSGVGEDSEQLLVLLPVSGAQMDPNLLDQPGRAPPAGLPVEPVIKNLNEHEKPPKEGETLFLVNPDKVQAQLEDDIMHGNAWRRRSLLHRIELFFSLGHL